MIKVIDATFSYKDKVILENSTFKFENGKLYFLVAKNGEGKSTLFKLLANELDLEQGNIINDGSVLYHRQKTMSFEDMTVKENLNTFSVCLSSKKSYSDILEKSQLRELENKVVKKLSGGEMQKLYLAISDMCNDKNVLYDEADSALDPLMRKRFYSIFLKEKANEGKTVIAISHHINDIVDYADEICFLKKGSLFRIKKDMLDKNFKDLNEEKMFENLERICELNV